MIKTTRIHLDQQCSVPEIKGVRLRAGETFISAANPETTVSTICNKLPTSAKQQEQTYCLLLDQQIS